MAITETRLGGSSSQNGYEYYAIVRVNDTINSDNTFTVDIDTYIVNHGTRTNSGGWTKETRINGVNEVIDTDQTLNTTGVAKEGGVTLAIMNLGYRVPITMSSIYVVSYMEKSSYTSYDPGYCALGGWVSMPKVMSMWNSSLLSIPNIETAFSLPINKYVSEYYNVVEVRNANNTQLIKTINDAVNGTSVTFTSSELSSIYTIDNNRNQLPLVFYLDLITYTDSSKTAQVGTTQRLKCEAYIVNGEPTLSATVVEQDAKVISLLGSSTSNKIIQNASDLLFTITPTALKGATISNVKVNDTYATYDSVNQVYVLNLTNITTGQLFITATDSRNLQGTILINKTMLEYIACKINTWSIERASQVSSDLILNANVNVWNSTINGNTNTIIVKYSIDNENWTTIPSTDYTITNNVLTISNLTLSNIIPYTSTTTFYLDISDLLSETKENYQISKGIETYSWGENDLQVNGEIYVADEEGENPISLTHNNSTSEKIIGYWIDNKPIYRKVGTGTSASGTVSINMGLSNIDTIISYKGVYNSVYPIPYATDTAGFTIETYRNNTNISVVFGSSVPSNKPFLIILEYTKTTD